jgi:hypothetical protein
MMSSKKVLPKEVRTMTRKTHHVVSGGSGGGWDIKKGGGSRSSGHFDNKQDAIDRGREISRNQRSELVIHNRDGKISQCDSHGNDPCPPKDKK